MADTTQAQAETVILYVTDGIFSDDSGADVDASVERFADILETQVEQQLGDRILNLEIRTQTGPVNSSIVIHAGDDMDADDERDLRDDIMRLSEDVLSGNYGDWVVEAAD